MNKKLVTWHVAGAVCIFLLSAALHFTFELTNFQSMIVAFFSAVNESIWEHLKMVFWAGMFFAVIEYGFIKTATNNYLPGKVASLFLAPLIIAVSWYIYTPFTGRSIVQLDITLCFVGISIGQVVSYHLMIARPLAKHVKSIALAGLAAMLLMFSTFTFFPPHIFLFEHAELRNTEQYGILEDYSELRVFTSEE